MYNVDSILCMTIRVYQPTMRPNFSSDVIFSYVGRTLFSFRVSCGSGLLSETKMEPRWSQVIRAVVNQWVV